MTTAETVSWTAEEGRIMMNTYYEVLRRRVRDLIAEHENVLGADAIISAVREAFEKEAMRLCKNGVYTRADRYHAVATALAGERLPLAKLVHCHEADQGVTSG
jgi:hypothetical protein